jgi:hypothetical protein
LKNLTCQFDASSAILPPVSFFLLPPPSSFTFPLHFYVRWYKNPVREKIYTIHGRKIRKIHETPSSEFISPARENLQRIKHRGEGGKEVWRVEGQRGEEGGVDGWRGGGVEGRRGGGVEEWRRQRGGGGGRAKGRRGGGAEEGHERYAHLCPTQ